MNRHTIDNGCVTSPSFVPVERVEKLKKRYAFYRNESDHRAEYPLPEKHMTKLDRGADARPYHRLFGGMPSRQNAVRAEGMRYN
jgi:hypothetical protein